MTRKQWQEEARADVTRLSLAERESALEGSASARRRAGVCGRIQQVAGVAGALNQDGIHALTDTFGKTGVSAEHHEREFRRQKEFPDRGSSMA